VLLAGGSAAWAQSDGSGGSGASGGAAQQGRRGHGARLALRTAATTIGVSPQDLAGQIRAGKTVAAVATEHNVDPAGVVNAVVAALTQQIDQAVAQGKFDGNRADQAKQKLPAFANRFVNETKPNQGRDREAGDEPRRPGSQGRQARLKEGRPDQAEAARPRQAAREPRAEAARRRNDYDDDDAELARYAG
jgi:hypothetical protein